VVFSAGRSGHVVRTDFRNLQSEEIWKVEEPILSLAMDKSHRALWVATTQPHIRQITLGPPASVELSTSAAASDSSAVDSGAVSRASRVICTLEGKPGLIRAELLNNRRQILAQDQLGELTLWDVTSGSCIDTFPVHTGEPYHKQQSTTFEQRCTETHDLAFVERLQILNEEVSLPNFFTIDTKISSITVNLNYPRCFACKVYVCEVFPLLKDPADLTLIVNYGRLLLFSIFRRWRTQVVAYLEEQQALRAVALQHEEEVKDDDDHSPTEGEGSEGETSTAALSNKQSTSSRIATREQATDLDLWPAPKYSFEMNENVLVIISDPNHVAPAVVKRVGEWSLNDPLPGWLKDTLLSRSFTPPIQPHKISFSMQPWEGCDLLPLEFPNLTAQSILTIRQLADYITPKVSPKREIHSTEGGQDSEQHESDPVERLRPVDLYIGKRLLQPSQNLAAVKQFYAKGANIEFVYRPGLLSSQ